MNKLKTIEDLEHACVELLGTALRHQLWTLFIAAGKTHSANSLCFSLSDLPYFPDRSALRNWSHVVKEAGESNNIELHLLIVMERPGGADLSSADFEWFQTIQEVLKEQQISPRALLLLSDYSCEALFSGPDSFLLGSAVGL